MSSDTLPIPKHFELGVRARTRVCWARGRALESKGMVGCMSGTLNAGQNAKQGGGTHA